MLEIKTVIIAFSSMKKKVIFQMLMIGPGITGLMHPLA